MHLTHQLNCLLSELGARHQIPNMLLAANGTLCVKLKEGAAELTFEFVNSSNAFFASTVLAEMPADTASRLALFKAMLDLNCLGLGTEGGILSLCRQSNRILYQKEIPLAGLDIETLDKTLDQVLATSVRLARILKRPIEEDSASHRRPIGRPRLPQAGAGSSPRM